MMLPLADLLHAPSRTPSTILAILLLTGCSSLSKVPIDPPALHPNSNQALPKPAKQDDDLNAAAVPLRHYLHALAAATRTTPATPRHLSDLADAGVTLVQVQCLRWFSLLSNRQHTKDFQDANYNVIRQLGTALLGIGSASSAIVSVYGAGNTAYEGVLNNFETSFLVAPNGKKVKQQVMRLLEEQELTVRNAASDTGATPLRVYLALEKYGDICSHSTAREIVNTALDQATATIDVQGNLRVEPSVNAQQIATLNAKEDARTKRDADLRKEAQGRVDQANRARDAALNRAASDAARIAELERQIEVMKQAQPPTPATPASR